MDKKIELGDIFSIKTKKGIGIMQLVKLPKNSNEIEKIRVFYNLYEELPNNIEGLVINDHFFIDFPVKAAIKQNIITKIGYNNLGKDFKLPNYYRTENIIGGGWQIIEAKTWKRKTVSKLNDEELKLSPWGMFNDTLIIEKLEEGWRLEDWK